MLALSPSTKEKDQSKKKMPLLFRVCRGARLFGYFEDFRQSNPIPTCTNEDIT
jgi:hypothetical protein